MKNALMISLSVLVGSGFFAGSANAQAPTQKEIADMAALYAQALISNREVLKGYSWQYRTEVWQNNELQWVDLVNANLDASGNPIFTQVNREQIVAQKRGLFSKPEQGKNFETVDLIIEYVKDWVVWYNRMPLSRVVALFEQSLAAGTVRTAHSSGSLLHVSGKNVRDTNANDQVSLWFNTQNGHPVQFSFTIPVEKSIDGATGQTISATIHYRYLRNGEAFYADHLEATVPSRGLRIKIENLNMQKKL